MKSPICPGLSLNSGMPGWPVVIPSASASSRELDRVSLMKRPERRRDGQRALRDFIDGMAMRAIRQRERLAGLGIVFGMAWSCGVKAMNPITAEHALLLKEPGLRPITFALRAIYD